MDLPMHPGVYLMKDKNGKIIYIGKSKVLRQRVAQYFAAGSDHSNKTARMVSDVCDFETMLTDTEIEALALENRLIKLHLPKYNIKLKDGKSYPYIKVTVNQPYPRVEVTRKRSNDGARYFGPYSGTGTAYTILKTVQKTFRVASCSREFPRDIGKSRPCLYKQLGHCIGPCSGEVTSEEYTEIFRDVLSFLRGSFGEVKSSLTDKMEYAAENLMFETAAIYRDRIEALERLWDKQQAVGAPDTEYDVFALYTDDTCSCLSVYYIRSGSVIDSDNFIFPAEQLVDSVSLSAFIADIYTKREFIPREILLGFRLDPDDIELLQDFLKAESGSKIKLKFPERGQLRKLCDMVGENARQQAEQYRVQNERDSALLVKLASMLALEVIPERIECFDISNYGSEHITAGMIVAENGKLRRSEYRVFNISGDGVPDDYAAMREAVSRRLDHTSVLPDLILLDGGRGHVSVIRALLDERGIDIPVFGMVKDSYHKTRALTTDSEEISIARDQAVFVFIYKLQEEVHRFTVSRMTGAKRRTLRTSALEKIKGIGEVKARELLRHFKSLEAIKHAGIEELRGCKGISAANAEAIYSTFHADESESGKPNDADKTNEIEENL
ncbi:MAG: excinuclease ABC subunit UvrC [Clostridiales bacterium]|nr:excinuclease ABC subunit UvrC [Clostridiales bacterium]